MKHGFIRVAAIAPHIRLADCSYNADIIINIIDSAEQKEVGLLVFPELCVTGYTCGDLFLQDILLLRAMEQVKRIAAATVGKELVTVIGFPYERQGRLYNTAAVLHGGRILGLVPKQNIPNYCEFYELRYFAKGPQEVIKVDFMGEDVFFGSRMLFECSDMPDFVLGVEICEDLWVPISPGNSHCLAGATVIANLSASNEIIGKAEYRRELVKSQSKRLICGYVYADAGEGESTTDLVFSGHSLIAENGAILLESEPFHNDMIINDIDLGIIMSDRRRMNNDLGQDATDYIRVKYTLSEDDCKLKTYELIRRIDPSPFVPADSNELKERCNDIFTIQAMGLKARLNHVEAKCALIGVSGGLDSTLALLVTHRAFELLGIDKKGIMAVTMPCFGTSERTYNNALSLAKGLGATVIEIPIKDAVMQHFKDIGHGIDTHDITYENAQARERTQVLMDLANQHNGLMIGPGDMSELVLGWTTYNGDHMSMYGVNSSVPKTLIRSIVKWYADSTDNKELAEVLKDVLDTPVSPELLPPTKGNEYQRTEDYIGPYELHDFFIFYVLRYGFSPEKVYRLAKTAFEQKFKDEEILKWLQLFYRRFFSQQYKRSCLPDGPKVGSVSISPRGDLRMPSDAKAKLWLDELKGISL
ncbi:MAG: NAD(+) synthase [Anaerolineaceae bacterium]|nr:MAG: NAD(+) synthase [Anaerolineaceae bacterium]